MKETAKKFIKVTANMIESPIHTGKEFAEIVIHEGQLGMAKASVMVGGGLLGGLLGAVVLLVVISKAFPILWPIAANTTAIDAMTGTDAGTTTFKALYTIVLLLVGLGVIIGLIMYALRRFKIGGAGL